MAATIHEVAPDVFRICIYVPEINLQFSQFLVRDDEPVLFHTLTNAMFPDAREGVAKLIDPAKIRWISFSHFEADECGSLNQWLDIAPQAQPMCAMLGTLLSVNDFAKRPARPMTLEDVVTTGKYRFRYIHTPHLPHGWDAGVMFEETQRTLFCSDLMHQEGDLEPLTTNDVLGRVRETLVNYEASPLLASYVPYTRHTGRMLEQLAALAPATLANQHGTVYHGDGASALRGIATIFKEVLGREEQLSATAAD